MKILIDLRSYQISKNRGIGRYVLALTEELAKISSLSVSGIISKDLAPVELSNNVCPKINLYVLENFEQYDIKENFDFFIKGNFFDDFLHESSTIYPPQIMQKCNDVVGILYDLIPLIYAGNYLDNEFKEDYIKNFELMKYASHFFCISKHTMQDGIKYTQLPENRFTNIYGSTDEQKFRTLNSDKPYVAANRLNNLIFTAGGDRRKNYHGVAKAFAMAYETGKLPQNAKLYLICANNEAFIKDVENAIQGYKAQIGKQIIITGYISDAELVDLLTTAKASIFPSFYEGLGLPILESYIAGTPSFASNCSSTKELVMKEASFDPHNMEEMRDIIIRIFNDEEFCKKSLEWGRKLLKKINWKNSAQIMVDKLTELQAENNKKASQKSSKTAVFTILPPMSSGIAPYSYKTHIAESEKYDMFSNIQNFADYMKLHENNVNNIFPLNFYEYADFKEKYKAELFVFGNSFHHKEILDYAMRTKDTKTNRFMYLHEAALLYLFEKKYYNGQLDLLKKFLFSWYPEKAKIINELNTMCFSQYLNKNKIGGIRPLINLTGIKHIFVNTQKAKQLIEEELTEYELKDLTIDIFYLPLAEIKAEKIDLHDNKKQKVIATFGIPSPLKMSDEIYQAVKLLNQQGHDIKLIYAGYCCSELKTKMPEAFVEIHDSPTDDELYSLMNSVDLAVQLRPDSHGESSGCIAQLLSLGKNILTTEGFVSDDLEQYCHTIVGIPDIAKLSICLIKAINKPKKYDAKKLIEQYSYKRLSQKLDTTIQEYLKANKNLLK